MDLRNFDPEVRSQPTYNIVFFGVLGGGPPSRIVQPHTHTTHAVQHDFIYVFDACFVPVLIWR